LSIANNKTKNREVESQKLVDSIQSNLEKINILKTDLEKNFLKYNENNLLLDKETEANRNPANSTTTAQRSKSTPLTNSNKFSTINSKSIQIDIHRNLLLNQQSNMILNRINNETNTNAANTAAAAAMSCSSSSSSRSCSFSSSNISTSINNLKNKANLEATTTTAAQPRKSLLKVFNIFNKTSVDDATKKATVTTKSNSEPNECTNEKSLELVKQKELPDTNIKVGNIVQKSSAISKLKPPSNIAKFISSTNLPATKSTNLDDYLQLRQNLKVTTVANNAPEVSDSSENLSSKSVLKRNFSINNNNNNTNNLNCLTSNTESNANTKVSSKLSGKVSAIPSFSSSRSTSTQSSSSGISQLSKLVKPPSFNNHNNNNNNNNENNKDNTQRMMIASSSCNNTQNNNLNKLINHFNSDTSSTNTISSQFKSEQFSKKQPTQNFSSLNLVYPSKLSNSHTANASLQSRFNPVKLSIPPVAQIQQSTLSTTLENSAISEPVSNSASMPASSKLNKQNSTLTKNKNSILDNNNSVKIEMHSTQTANSTKLKSVNSVITQSKLTLLRKQQQMNETFDIENSESDESIELKSEQSQAVVKLRENTSKSSKQIFDDIDESKQRRSILSFENNFDLMQTGAYMINTKNNSENLDIDDENAPSMNVGMDFLENELIPDELLDDVYNFSETNSSTLNGSSICSAANLTSTSGFRKLSNKSSFKNNSKNLDWLSSQISALDTDINRIHVKSVDTDMEIENDDKTDVDQRLQLNDELLNQLSENLELPKNKNNATKTENVELNQRVVVENLLNELVEKVSQLNEAKLICTSKQLLLLLPNTSITSLISYYEHEHTMDYDENENSTVQNKNEILMGKFNVYMFF
jgi:hypothetical protein